MPLNYKTVPAIDKCFSILSMMAEAKRPVGFNEIVKKLGLNKSTVFYILYTLNYLDVLEKGQDGYRLGSKLFVLGSAAAGGSELIKMVHPYLEAINKEFKFSTFLGILSGHKIIILDKADRAQMINVSTDVGMRIPLFAGAAGKALLSQLPEEKIDKILSETPPKQYTSLSIVDKTAFKNEVMSVKESGIAYDQGEYIEGLVSISIPLQTCKENLQGAIWGVGFKHEFREDVMVRITKFLLNIQKEINSRFLMIASPWNKFKETPN
jgi:DNA-binding IclR family transcriptional regulator